MQMQALNGEVEEESRDLISDLPVPILHQVLSFLSYKDSVRTSVLSKQWYLARKSFPVLRFSKRISSWAWEYKERVMEYLDCVDRSLQHFVHHKLCIDSLDLCLNLPTVHFDFVPRISTWLRLALHSGVSDLKFECTIDDYEFSRFPLPEMTFAVYPSLLLGSSEFFRLQKLELHKVCLSEDIVRDIIRNCPNLDDLNLCYIWDLETLNISEPSKLVSLSVERGEINNFFIDALSLCRFSLELKHQSVLSVITLTSCSNLRELDLDSIAITDDVFHLHISSILLLEDLNISNCGLLRRIKISLPRLKNLQLISCSQLEAVEIDAPLLSVFKLVSGNFPELVTSGIMFGSMYFCYDIHRRTTPINQFWFLHLREFLGVPFDRITIGTCMNYMKVNFAWYELDFDYDELSDFAIPPLVEMESLDLSDTQIHPLSYWVNFLKGLLWSCHPKTIRVSVTADSSNEDSCIKVLCNMLMQNQYLKSGKIKIIGGDALNIESTGGIEHELFLHLSDTFSAIPVGSTVFFRLDWDHSAIQGLALL